MLWRKDPEFRRVYGRLLAGIGIIFMVELLAMSMAGVITGQRTPLHQDLLDGALMVLISLPLLKIFIVDKWLNEMRLRAFNERLYRILNSMRNDAASPGAQRDFFRGVLEQVVSSPVVGVERKAALFLMRGEELELVADIGFSEQQLALCGRMPLGRCLCGRAAKAGKSIFATSEDPEHEIHPDGMAPHAHYCVPVKTARKTIGMLTLYLRSGHKRDEGELRFLESVCGIVAEVVRLWQLERDNLQLQKMESVGRFAGSIAHDFNNLLTMIKGFNELVADTINPADPAAPYVGETQKALLRAEELVRRLLAFSRKQPEEMLPLDLNGLISSMRGVLEMAIEKKCRLQLDLSPGLPAVKASRNQLEQVLMNLAVNARDAMPSGGVLSISTECLTDAASARCPGVFRHGARAVRVAVSDTGTGMDKTTLSRLFEPFFTTKPEGQGTGLGLSTVQTIVKHHSGCVNVQSEPGKGSCFEVWLPAGLMERAGPGR